MKRSMLGHPSDYAVRTDWTRPEIAALFDLSFDELVYQAATVHRAHHAAGQIQLCTLLSIKTGGCPEDCGYCSQSVKADSGVAATKLMDVQAVLQKAAEAADAGSRRFCMGAAWRNPKDRDMPAIVQIVQGVRAMGMETCMTLGMLTPSQADMLADAGLDYYNHNIDTSPERYNEIITTRTMDDRLDTLAEVRRAGINVCSGGIVGLGETRADRVGFKYGLASDVGGGTSYSMLQTLNEGYKVLQLQGQSLHPLRAFHWITRGNAVTLGLDDKIGTLAVGSEADIVVLDARATPAMELRMERAETLSDELFILQILGDDRAVAEVYIAGQAQKHATMKPAANLGAS